MVDTDGLMTAVSNVEYMVSKAIEGGPADKKDLECIAANVEEVYSEVVRIQGGRRNNATAGQMIRHAKDLVLEALIRVLKRGLS